ncbi:unnamed protein product [Ectocarpus sp. CCAP 1310/34]|nr:unnamed protein product [Ectocarpus sp. CCAP 1310/34]
MGKTANSRTPVLLLSAPSIVLEKGSWAAMRSLKLDSSLWSIHARRIENTRSMKAEDG